MTEEFINKIIKEKIVDTNKYRYVCEDYADRREIQRLPLVFLDTTDAINGWEIIKVFK